MFVCLFVSRSSFPLESYCSGTYDWRCGGCRWCFRIFFSPQVQRLSWFASWFDSLDDPPTAIIDGPNVAYMAQNYEYGGFMLTQARGPCNMSPTLSIFLFFPLSPLLNSASLSLSLVSLLWCLHVSLSLAFTLSSLGYLYFPPPLFSSSCRF